MKIYINSGHMPREESGAVNVLYGLTEAEFTLKIGRQLQFYLNNVGIKCEWIQTNNLRNNPYDDNLTQPCIISEINNSGCDYAISIHLNAYNGLARGTENIVWCRGCRAELLAKHIQKHIVDSMGTIDRGIKYEEDKPKEKRLSFIMLTNMPAIIVECCFIDNNEDVKYLFDDGADKFAKAIYDGIIEFLGWEIKNA